MIQKITQQECEARQISALKTRPNAPKSMGGNGLTSVQLRQKFDALGLLLVERYNDLIDAVFAQDGNSSILDDIRVTIGEDVKSLREILDDMVSGDIVHYFNVDENTSLSEFMQKTAPIDSPDFSGSPEAPTPPDGDASKRIANTAWVMHLLKAYEELYTAVINGTYGTVPKGGTEGQLLTKKSDRDNDVAWATFDIPQNIATQSYVDTAVNTAKAEILGGAGGAYDTLKELETAVKSADGKVTQALADIAQAESKTVFEYYQYEDILSDPDAESVHISVESNHDYRTILPSVRSLSLEFPEEPDNSFIASVSFPTPQDADLMLSYTNSPNIYATGDDCTDGVFIPIRGANYTVIIWFDEYPYEYQWVVRRGG